MKNRQDGLAGNRTRKADSGCLTPLICCLFLAVLTVSFFWPVVTQSRFFWGDFQGQDFPWRHLAASGLRQGTLRLWNPYTYSGMPFLADVQTAMLYPLNLVLALGVREGSLSAYALEWQIILHFFLAGVFMFALLRYFRLSCIGALFGAISFMFTGFLVAHLGHVGMLNVAVWIPLVFLFFHKSITTKSWPSAVWGGLFYGICILAGHSQPALYILMVMGLFFLYHVVLEALKTGQPFKAALPSTAIFALMLSVTFCVAAAQILPMAELAKQSVRSGDDFQFATSYSLPPRHLITLLIPKFFGITSEGKRYWGEENFTELCIYVGVLPLILAFVGGMLKRNKETFFFLVVAGVSLVLALGKHTFIYGFLFHFVPIFRIIRIPARFGYLMAFSTAALSGFGAEALLSRLNDDQRRVLKIIGLAIAFLAILAFLMVGVLYIYWLLGLGGGESWQTENVIDESLLFLFLMTSVFVVLWVRAKASVEKWKFVLSLFAILIVDLFTFGSHYNLSQRDPNDFLASDRPALRYLIDSTDDQRFDNVSGLPYNAASRLGLFDIGGWNPFRLASYERFRETLNPADRLRYALSVKFVTSYDLLVPSDIRNVGGAYYDVGHMEPVGRPTGNAPMVICNLPFMLSDTIGVVSELGYAIHTPQGSKVAELLVENLAGEQFGFPIRAGVDSSEWAYDYADNLPYLQHERATVAWSYERGGIPGHAYVTRFQLEDSDYIRKLILIPTDANVVVNLYGFSLIDSQSGRSQPIGCGRLRLDRQLEGVKFHRTRTYLPRAFLVHEVETVSSFGEALARVQENAFDLYRKVFIETKSDIRFDLNASPIEEFVQVIDYQTDRIVIRADAAAPGILVLNDVLYPGWTAFLDGNRTQLYRANGVMRAIHVPPGRHWIEMRYCSVAFARGATISVGALLVLLIALLRKLIPRR